MFNLIKTDTGLANERNPKNARIWKNQNGKILPAFKKRKAPNNRFLILN